MEPQLNNATLPKGMTISPVVLVLANLIPLAGVLWWGWSVASIVIFYWSENLIVGFYNILKMLTAGVRRSIFLACFFTMHYGGFCAGHGFFVVELFGLDTSGEIPQTSESWGGPLVFFQLIWEAMQYVHSIAPDYWLWGFAALAFSHGISYLSNWWLAGERLQASADKLMIEPYRRIIILHVVVIFGGLGIETLGSPLPLLLLLIALKIGVDLYAHLREHGISWRSILGRV